MVIKLPKFDLLASNTKLDKSQKKGWLNLGLSLAPADESGFQVCAFSSAGCRTSCLFTAGRGKMPNVVASRIRKTREFFADKGAFLRRLAADIDKAQKWCDANGWKLCIRLNVLSDIRWENQKLDGKNLFDTFPNVQFMDYTKNPNRMEKFIAGELSANYHLTFSRSEENGKIADAILASGGNVATVFRPVDPKAKKRTFDLPEFWNGRPVHNGDETDLRFLDPKGVTVGLRVKGDAWRDVSGFVVNF